MVRRILGVFLLLLVAMAINLAVAWGAVWLCAHTTARQAVQIQDPPTAIPSNDISAYWQEAFGPSVFVAKFADADEVKSAPVSPDFGTNLFCVREDRREGFGCSSISINDELHQAPIAMELLTAGWPMPALRCERVFGAKKYAVHHAWMAFANNGTRAGGMILPCKPMWTGAIVNTLFYAMLLLLISFGVTSGRRALRRRGKRCVACGYDLRAATSDVCPECGMRREVSRRV